MTQSEQLAQAALQAPINNLVILVALFSLVILLLAGFAIWKVAPALINLYKAQAETNRQNADTSSKLTTIVGQNVETSRLSVQSVEQNTSEMVKQTAAIENQTGIIAGQGKDLRTYQTLVSDNLSAHTDQIAANTANIEALKVSIEALSEQIRGMLEDKTAYLGIQEIIKKIQDEIIGFMQNEQAKHASTNGSTVHIESQT